MNNHLQDSQKTAVINDANIIGEVFDESGNWAYAFDAMVNTEAEINIGVTVENQLDIQLVGDPVVSIYNVNFGDLMVPPALIDSVIKSSMPSIVSQLGGTLGVVAIPVFFGFTIDVDEIWDADVSKTHLGIGGSLVRIEEKITERRVASFD